MNKILMVLCVAVCACGSSCGAAQVAAGGSVAVVDCTIQHGEQVAELVKLFGQGRAPDWGNVESRAMLAGRVIGGCALTRFVEQWISGALASLESERSMTAMAGQVFTLADVIKARQVLARFRDQHSAVYVMESGGDL